MEEQKVSTQSTSRNVLEKLESKVDAIVKYLQSISKPINPLEVVYLTRKEVCAYCGNVSTVTLHNWRKKGLLVPRKYAGRKPLYLLEDVEAFLDRQENEDSNIE